MALRFIEVRSIEKPVEYLSELLKTHLEKGENVLWLVAGGSAMDIAAEVAKRLSAGPNLERLTVTLTDERYGPVGHPDSNWRQLSERGFLLPGAHLMAVLDGSDMDGVVQKFAAALEKSIGSADYSVALAGMGADGHIFGIKAGSSAVDSPQNVVGYKWDDYERVTPTINLIKKLDEVVIYAVGQEKHRQL